MLFATGKCNKTVYLFILIYNPAIIKTIVIKKATNHFIIHVLAFSIFDISSILSCFVSKTSFSPEICFQFSYQNTQL